MFPDLAINSECSVVSEYIVEIESCVEKNTKTVSELILNEHQVVEVLQPKIRTGFIFYQVKTHNIACFTLSH